MEIYLSLLIPERLVLRLSRVALACLFYALGENLVLTRGTPHFPLEPSWTIGLSPEFIKPRYCVTGGAHNREFTSIAPVSPKVTQLTGASYLGKSMASN